MKGKVGNPDGNTEEIRGEEAKHGGDGPLHGVLGGARNALCNDGRVEWLNLPEHSGKNRKFSAEGGFLGGHEIVGNTATIDSGDETAENRWGEGFDGCLGLSPMRWTVEMKVMRRREFEGETEKKED